MNSNIEIDNQPQAPIGLSALATGPGVNRIAFLGSGPDYSAYEVWRRHGDTVDWYLHATIDALTFDDSPVESGQYYEYKVRAVGGGEFSSSAVVYGK